MQELETMHDEVPHTTDQRTENAFQRDSAAQGGVRDVVALTLYATAPTEMTNYGRDAHKLYRTGERALSELTCSKDLTRGRESMAHQCARVAGMRRRVRRLYGWAGTWRVLVR